MHARSLALLLLSLSACAQASRAPESSAMAEPVPDEPVSESEPAAPEAPAPAVVQVSVSPVPTPISPLVSATRAQAEQRGPLLFAALEQDAGAGDADGGVTLTISEPTTVLVILDQSGSMAAPWAGGQTRWTAANKALIAALEPPRAQLTIGAILFPLPGACSVTLIDEEGQFPFQPGPVFIDIWKQTIRAGDPSGSTPLEHALAAADAALAAAGELLQRRSMVLVITDGEPTCNDDLEELERFPATWLARGIPTHVMGLPGSEAAMQLLDRVARAGGTGQHTPIGSPDQLQMGVAQVLASRRFGP